MGEFFGVGFNWLGWLTLLAFVVLLGYATFRAYIIFKIKMDESKKPKKKRDLPLMVRRRGGKNATALMVAETITWLNRYTPRTQ